MLLLGSDGSATPFEGHLIGAREGLLAEPPDGLLELVEVRQPAVHRRELDRRHGIQPGQAALGEIADPLGLHLRPAAADVRRDRVGQLLELLASHRTATGRPNEPSLQLSPVEALGGAVALDHVDRHVLGPFVRGEPVAAAGALAAAADRVAGVGQTRVCDLGRFEGAERAAHGLILLHVVADSCTNHNILWCLRGEGGERPWIGPGFRAAAWRPRRGARASTKARKLAGNSLRTRTSVHIRAQPSRIEVVRGWCR